MTKPIFTSKPVVISIADSDFTFTPSVADANNYTNSVSLESKVEPARTYLERSVDSEKKSDLVELMDLVPGLVMDVFSTVHEAAKGGVKVTLKNSMSA